MESQLKLYSIGIVVESKARGSDYVKVSPMEALPLQKGDMTTDKRAYQSDAPDASGVPRTSKVQGSNHIVAKWMPKGSDNRISAPDVQAGESVELYRFADTDEYYWATLFREPKLRKLETILFAASNQPGSGDFSKESSYYAEVSTHDSHIQVHTSQSNGEPYAYDIKIDAASGKVTIADSIGNSLTLDSAQSSISLVTNTSITLKAPTVSIEANDVKIKGNLALDGTLSGTQGATFTQNVTAPNI